MCKYVEFAFLMLHDLDKLEDPTIHYSKSIPKETRLLLQKNTISLIIRAFLKKCVCYFQTALHKELIHLKFCVKDFSKNSIVLAYKIGK